MLYSDSVVPFFCLSAVYWDNKYEAGITSTQHKQHKNFILIVCQKTPDM